MSFRSIGVPSLVVLCLCGVVLGSVGCAGPAEFPMGPPAGWEGDEGRWWLAGQDTTGFFPVMETIDDLGVEDDETVFLAPGEVAALRRNDREQFERAVKRSLIRLYRNEPAIVDSIFVAHIRPMLGDVKFTNDPVQDVEKFKQKAYKLMRERYFREPRTRLELGTDVPIVYPDSLREKGVEGAVVLQVRLDSAGTPLSIELIKEVHPVLDQIAMEATTRMRWLPAYVIRKKDWQPIPSWARFRISFSSQPTAAD